MSNNEYFIDNMTPWKNLLKKYSVYIMMQVNRNEWMIIIPLINSWETYKLNHSKRIQLANPLTQRAVNNIQHCDKILAK